ncbi:MAG: ribose 5-phosphate isomerase B [Syntrophomonadaceae bacterium]|jgi:RpiB/LacA/LacB family sugar-phosphate isomerase
MQVVIGSDHAGVDLKAEVLNMLKAQGIEVCDCGAYSAAAVDYPDIAEKVAEKVVAHRCPGILICGTGIGIAMAANKVPGVRAAVCLTPEMARLAREHNDANIISLGARLVEKGLAMEMIKTFLNTPFQAGRHQTRVEKISRLEKKCRERS